MIPENVEVPVQSDFANDEAIDAWDAQYGVRTQDMVQAAGDDRALFYSGAGGGRRTMNPASITGFQSGLSIVNGRISVRTERLPAIRSIRIRTFLYFVCQKPI